MAVEYSDAGGRAGRRPRADRVLRVVGARRRGMVLRLRADDQLFAPDQSKEGLVYRVRKGRLEVSGVMEENEPGGAPKRFYGPGEFVGLGFLEAHAAFAHAVEATEAVVWSRADFDKVCEQKPDYRAQLNDAVRLEFLWHRARTVAEGSEEDAAE